MLLSLFVASSFYTNEESFTGLKGSLFTYDFVRILLLYAVYSLWWCLGQLSIPSLWGR